MYDDRVMLLETMKFFIETERGYWGPTRLSAEKNLVDLNAGILLTACNKNLFGNRDSLRDRLSKTISPTEVDEILHARTSLLWNQVYVLRFLSRPWGEDNISSLNSNLAGYGTRLDAFFKKCQATKDECSSIDGYYIYVLKVLADKFTIENLEDSVK